MPWCESDDLVLLGIIYRVRVHDSIFRSKSKSKGEGGLVSIDCGDIETTRDIKLARLESRILNGAGIGLNVYCEERGDLTGC
jgi:hypothetical protein